MLKEKRYVVYVFVPRSYCYFIVKIKEKSHIPISIMSMTTSLAWTSIVTKAPRVVLVCFESFPLTSPTISFS